MMSDERATAALQSIDKDNSGTITADELRQAMQEQGSSLAKDELEQLLSQIDVDKSNTIDYDEFLAATVRLHGMQFRCVVIVLLLKDEILHQVNLSQLEKEENMYKAFQHFDTDNSGYITKDELEAGLKARYIIFCSYCGSYVGSPL